MIFVWAAFRCKRVGCCLILVLIIYVMGHLEELGDGGLGLAVTQCLDVSRDGRAEVGVDCTRVSSVGRVITGSVNDLSVIKSIYCLACIILVISLLLRTGVCFDKCGRFLLGVVVQTLANSLMGSGGENEGRGRDLVSRLDLLVVFGRILGSQGPGWCVVYFLRQGVQAGNITDLVIVMITHYKRVDCSLMLVLIIYVTEHLGGLGGGGLGLVITTG